MRGKTAIVTGGASGIGRAIASAMARRGARVVLADRQIELAREVAAELVARGGLAEARELDVRDADAFVALAKDVRARHGSIDYLFNNAGIGVAGEMREYDRAAWDEVLDVNVRGVAYGVHAVYPIMCAQGSGHIVNTASMAGLLPTASAGSYTTSKHAVVGLSKALRIEAAVYGVRVSALCPGVIRTPILTGGRYGGQIGRRLPTERMLELWEQLRPMDPDAFAAQVLADVERDEPTIIVPRWWRAAWLVERVTPRVSSWLWSKVHARAQAAIAAHGERAPHAPAPHAHAARADDAE